MKPAPFKYVAPQTRAEALEHLARHGDEAKIIAGGQSLMPLLALRMARPEILIDINRIADLAESDEEDGHIRIGAMVRQDSLENGGGAARRLPLLGHAIGHVGHAATRSRGTLGGSLAHADPAAELPVCMLALDAELAVSSTRGERSIAARDFFDGPLTTVLEADELLTRIDIPVGANGAGTGSSFLEVARRHGDFALVAVACVVSLSQGSLSDVRLAAGGAGDRPLRLAAAEAVLQDQAPSPELFAEAANRGTDSLDPFSDLHASADYRRKLAVTLTRRALQAACEAATEKGTPT